jgi:hypothetical protein
MQDYSTSMFDIPLTHYVVRDWEMKKEQLLSLLKNSIIDSYDNFKTSFNSQEKDSLYKFNESFNNIFNEEIELFLDQFGFNDYQITKSWFEVEEQNMYRGINNHGYGVSAMCYIQFDDTEHNTIEFLSPFNNFLNGTTQIYTPELNEGSLIFFPSSINYYTSPNKSKKEKISSLFLMKMD